MSATVNDKSGNTTHHSIMGLPREPDPSLLVVACISRHQEALAWAREKMIAAWGPLGPVSPDFSFHHTTYYEANMGPGLVKRLLTFANLVPSNSLAQRKLLTNDLEKELADSHRFPDPRPLNLDPGFLQLGKFLLATTKDQAHRIYLRDGIFAEVTLRFQDGAFEVWPWTYRSYQEPAIRAFLKEAREYYRQRLSSG